MTILVSIDGFRADYLDRGVTPNLIALAAAGVSAAMRPSFPSQDLPQSLGDRDRADDPDHHGIIANKMEDPARPGETFTMATDDPFWWNSAEPIWVDRRKGRHPHRDDVLARRQRRLGRHESGGVAERRHRRHAAGGLAAVQPGRDRRAARRMRVLDWLRRPAAIRPQFVTLYFDTVDTAGHEYGPDDARTTAAVADVDREIGMLVDGLDGASPARQSRHRRRSRHGRRSAATAVVALDQIAPAADYRVIESGPLRQPRPDAGP